MTDGLNYASVCSGIDMASVAWAPLGWRSQFLSEIDPFASHVLHHRYSSCRPQHMPNPNEPGLSAKAKRDRRNAIKAVAALPEQARMAKGVNATMDEGQTMVPVAFNARQDPVPSTETTGAIDTDGYSQAVAFKAAHFTRGKDGAPAEVAFPLSADADKGDQDTLICAPAVAATLTRGAESAGKGGYAGRRQEDDVNIVAIQERAVSENPDAGPDGAGFRTDGAAYTMEARTTAQAVAYMPARTLAGDGGVDERYAERDVCDALHTNSGNGNKAPMLQIGWRVRRLLPVECERLQGAEDGYTLVPYRGKPASDGPRYKTCGNAYSANVIRWIGMRIDIVRRIP